MKFTLTLILLMTMLFTQAQEIATTKSGRTVILFEDHTWKYYEIQKKQTEPKKQSLPKKPGLESKQKQFHNTYSFLNTPVKHGLYLLP